MGAISRRDVVLDAVPVSDIVSELGESPLWIENTGLRWLDVAGKSLHTRHLDGSTSSVGLSGTVTAVELSRSDDLFAVTGSGFGWVLPHTGEVRQVADSISEPDVTMNDGGIDGLGRCWAGSAVRDDSRRGELYRFDGASVTSHARGLSMSNGLDWSPDNTVLYHADSTAGTVTAWDFDLVSGNLGESRILAEIPASVGLPDGLTVDEAGDVWLAIWGPGQVWRLDSRTGETTAIVDVPTPCTTSCAFGGPDLRTLYITTANHERPEGGGLLYAVDAPVGGRHPHRFAGALR
ncbi:SMP-30/gluconolactonase/LRE family protein [Saccharomonospora sp. NPDC006951]